MSSYPIGSAILQISQWHAPVFLEEGSAGETWDGSAMFPWGETEWVQDPTRGDRYSWSICACGFCGAVEEQKLVGDDAWCAPTLDELVTKWRKAHAHSADEIEAWRTIQGLLPVEMQHKWPGRIEIALSGERYAAYAKTLVVRTENYKNRELQKTEEAIVYG